MAIVCLRQGSLRLILLGSMLMLSTPLCGQQARATVDQLIGRLDHDSFATRQSAARSLLKDGIQEGLLQVATEAGKTGELGVISALHDALSDPSVEVRLAVASILSEISVAIHDAELERLLNPHCEAATIHLDHWRSFSHLVGDDPLARHAFATMSRRFGGSPLPVRAAASQRWKLGSQLDPYRLDPEDAVAWMTLLMLDLEQHASSPHWTPRIAIALSHCPMGPVVSSSMEGAVLGRMIDRWVRDAGPLCAERERLLIAMRYDRREVARALSRRVLDSHDAPAATIVTALLAASVLQRDDLERQAIRRLEDDRVAHVWQLIPSRKTKIRTEVRDVALALLLHHHGIDPREAGFAELQADPTFRYLDHSLGFPDDTSRSESQQRATRMLAFLASQGPAESAWQERARQD